MQQQTPGHLYGPPVPHIAFYYGEMYLGEVRGHPSNVRAAEWKLMEQTELLYPGPDGSARRSRICNADRVMLYCGENSVDLLKNPYRPSMSEQIRRQGYSTVRDGDVGLQYILTVVHDPVRNLVVGLLKQKGPEFLIGKLTFPGGKLEEGETPEEAASREIREEAGLDIAVDAWKFVCRHECLMVLAASSDDVIKARQLESEPIYVMSVPRQQSYAMKNPDAYAPDFLITLRASLDALANG